MPTLRDIDGEKYPECVWFARNLQRLRERLQLTQGAFAKLVGLSQPFVSALEGLKANPTLQIMSVIARATGCPVSLLVSEEELDFTPSEEHWVTWQHLI